MSSLHHHFLGMLSLAAFFFLGCNQGKYENQMEGSLPRSPSLSRTLDLGFSPVTSAGLFATAICEDQQFIKELEALGWSLTCTPVFSGAEIRSGIEAGWLDLGTIDEQIANAACSSGVTSILTIADQSYKSLITATPRMVYEISVMSIGAPGGFIHLSSFIKQMHDWGLNPSEEKFLTAPLIALPRLLYRGKVDAIVSWEPLSSLHMADFPEWHYLLRQVGTTYWAIHPLLRQDTNVTLSFLRAQIRQLHHLKGFSHRFDMERRRWEYASTIGFPVQSPKSIQMLAEKPTFLSLSPVSYIATPNILIPSTCVEQSFFDLALHQLRMEKVQ